MQWIHSKLHPIEAGRVAFYHCCKRAGVYQTDAICLTIGFGSGRADDPEKWVMEGTREPGEGLKTAIISRMSIHLVSERLTPAGQRISAS